MEPFKLLKRNVAQIYFVPNWVAVVPKNSFEQSIIQLCIVKFVIQNLERFQWTEAETSLVLFQYSLCNRC